MKYCGIDLHSNNSVVSVIDEADHVVAERRLPNELGNCKSRATRTGSSTFCVSQVWSTPHALTVATCQPLSRYPQLRRLRLCHHPVHRRCPKRPRSRRVP